MQNEQPSNVPLGPYELAHRSDLSAVKQVLAEGSDDPLRRFNEVLGGRTLPLIVPGEGEAPQSQVQLYGLLKSRLGEGNRLFDHLFEKYAANLPLRVPTDKPF